MGYKDPEMPLDYRTRQDEYKSEQNNFNLQSR